MDIRSGAKYPAGALSNFAPHPFVFRECQINSMEGFLQGLKFAHPGIQCEVFEMVGAAAKSRGRRKNYGSTLWFQGNPICRFSDEYQVLLNDVYLAMFTQNKKARAALLASGSAVLKHSIGRQKQADTVLTRTEFCSRLMRIRDVV